VTCVEEEARWQGLVAQVAASEGAPERLRQGHRDDGHGHCVACSMPGSGQQRFPCTLYHLALAAAEVAGQRRAEQTYRQILAATSRGDRR
jgi:hypothetical protein